MYSFIVGRFARLLVLSLASLAVSVPLFAQETVNSASVSGVVTDPTGALVVGASVTARQTETSLISTSTTDNQGRFRFPYLKVGPYEIKIQRQGFSDASRSVNLTVGAAFELAIPLSLGSAQETVSVSTEPALVETARTQVAGTVLQNEVSTLQNSRSEEHT